MYKNPAAILTWQPRPSLLYDYRYYLQKDERGLAYVAKHFDRVRLASVHFHANKKLPHYDHRTG